MPPIYTDTIPVLRGHLEELYEAVQAAYGFHAADDLSRSYKNVGGTNRPSNLTKRLDKAVGRVEGYLTLEETEEAEVVDE